jgi:hypothetical protein
MLFFAAPVPTLIYSKKPFFYVKKVIKSTDVDVISLSQSVLTLQALMSEWKKVPVQTASFCVIFAKSLLGRLQKKKLCGSGSTEFFTISG